MKSFRCLVYVFFSATMFIFLSCVKDKITQADEKASKYTPPFIPLSDEQREEHPYGGWSCPDNILGFPAVDIDTLDAVPVILNRLPTKEETQNGSSLIYIDTSKVKNAKVIDLQLPRLATYYSKHTGKDEKVIVIQAFEIDDEKIVGFRNINGGNGSCWIEEIDFMSESEIQKIGKTPFVQESIQLSAKRMDIWNVVTNSSQNNELLEVFQDVTQKKVKWIRNGAIELKNDNNESITKGVISALWEGLYIQSDYDMHGRHYTEKFLILPDGEDYKLHVVAGPFYEDFTRLQTEWQNWLKKVKALSEEN